jgi:hypothetical protein
VREQAGAELSVDPAGRVGKEVCPKSAEDDIEQADRQETDREDFEGGEAVVDENLVDHDLEKQRRHESEYLDEERGQENVAQQMPVFDDRGHEPADVE